MANHMVTLLGTISGIMRTGHPEQRGEIGRAVILPIKTL